MKNEWKKRIKIVLLLITISTIIFANSKIFADIEDIEEQVDIGQIIETINNIKSKPELNSRVALIYDRSSGRILYNKNGNKQTPMASTTKIMTAIIVLEKSNLKDVVTIDSKAAGTGGSRLGLKKNDKITVNDLLYGLMLRSGNDAAIALAQHVAGGVSEFSNLMNQKATELGLINTHFEVPHGLDMKGHYTTAYELAKITDYALKIDKIKEIVGTKSYTITINGYSKTISNTNELLGNLEGVYGVKTGFTNGAGRCLVTSCKKGDLDIITVVIGADTKKYRTSDSIKLIEYANQNYEMVNIREEIDEQFEKWKKINQNRIIINKGTIENIELKLEELPYNKIAIKKTEIDNIEIEINSLFYLEAPINKKEIIGNLKVSINGEIIEILNIYNEYEIRKKDIIDYLTGFLKIYVS